MIDYLKTTWSADNLSDDTIFNVNTAHIEFGKNLYQLKPTSDVINPDYFTQVEKEMITLFNALFTKNEAVMLIVQLRSDTVSSELDLKNIVADVDLINTQVYSVWENFDGVAYQEQVCEFYFSVHVNDINASSLFTAITNQDFPERAPQILGNKSDDMTSFVYFVNKRVIFNPYDDRGGYVRFFHTEDYNKFLNSNKSVLMARDD